MLERSGFHKAPSQAQIDSTTLPPMGTPEESIPIATVRWNRDDDRARYLGLRSSGLSIRETLGLLGKHKSTLSKWRLDQEFRQLEKDLPELRKTLALEYAGLEYLRNFRLVMEKDCRVLKGSLTRKHDITDDGRPYIVQQDSQDFQYLLKLRAYYTPQQMQIMEQLFGRGATAGKEFNWMDVVTTLSRTREEIRIETRQRSPSPLAHIDENLDEPEVELNDKTELGESDAEKNDS